MKYIVIVLVLSFLQSCASVKVTPPTARNIDRTQTYSLSFDKTWNRAVDWFADHNITIDKIEKTSGLLSAKYLLNASDKQLDCGEINTSGFLGTPVIKKYLAINLTVREVDTTTTKVNVNSFGEFQLSGNDAWDARLITSDGRCLSTGEIEASILKFIGYN